MTVHPGGSGDAGANEVVGIVSAATQGEGGLWRVDDAGEGCVGAEIHCRIRRQAKVLKVLGQSRVVDDAISAEDGAGGRNIYRDVVAGRNTNLVLRTELDA